MSRLLNQIAQSAAICGGSIALSDELRTYTYDALDAEVRTVARMLREELPGNGPVALVADNSCAWVLLDLALIALKRPLVPLPGFFTHEQRNSALVRVGAQALICDAAGGNAPAIDVGGKQFHIRKLNSLPVELPGDTAKVTFTSGTTGNPKGVCLSQSAMERVSLSLVDAIGKDKAGVHVPILPLAVLLENVGGLYTTLLAGGHYRALSQAEIGFAKPFEPDFAKLIGALADNKATSVIMVPEILRAVTGTLFRSQAKLPELKYVAVGGARVSGSLLDMAQRLHLPVYQGYGLSEAGSVVTLNTTESDRPGSVGKPLPHIKLSLAADGEILIEDPGFLGYLGDAAAPKIYETGDIGRFDDAGFLYVSGRKSNILITAYGRNISPEWVESEITADPAVYQAFVFGEASARLSVLVVPTQASVSSDRIAAAIGAANAKLPDYAKVGRWSVVAPFTAQEGLLTSNGRLQRDAIKQKYSPIIEQIAMPNFYETLVMETATQQAYLVASKQIRRGLVGDISLEAYLEYLAEAYHHVRHTVPLMQFVKSRLPSGREWLEEALDEYIAEESGHEEWILDDIRNAGGDAEAVRLGRPNMATEFMVSYAYDFINRVNPVGFFGMVFVLEGTSTKLATTGAEALMRSLGLKENCFRYWLSHGALDLEHMDFFRDLMTRIEHTEDQEAIIHMAQRMFILFANVFRSIPPDSTARNAAL
ncbi:AMP-binding protein [Bradyrhizobium erythrophlei]|uniref:Long-chain acyl-CoA synthetase (AMP-forming) n=1 Tax=Bradyrhizobium erythrophlei TaxID=1437360 RepID=A0A1M7U5P4_9BRAD|nr:AMP-binding protein [Bradyrhizobium erythrophlei]SHN78207.1 Long-chain acyl-CoA synthetase (AMP-forming) [Bradyrhizobium erythrophlei]